MFLIMITRNLILMKVCLLMEVEHLFYLIMLFFMIYHLHIDLLIQIY